MKASGNNSAAGTWERTVLPRGVDHATDMAELGASGADLDVLILDFSDAFKNLIVDPCERRFLSGLFQENGINTFFTYKVLSFGVVGGPLLWGRVAALVMRGSASMFHPAELAINCFVDDPIVALRGPR